MSNTRSDSSESTSIYETPINSPSNESLLDSTRIDSSLFGNTSVTQSIDVLDFHQSLHSIPTSDATESTLRQTAQRLSSGCLEDGPHCQHSTDALIDTSVWLPTQMSSLRNQLIDSNPNDVYNLVMKYMSELEGDQLDLIGVEQQIHSLSLKCRTIRENMVSKTNAINLLIHEMLPKKKQTAQRQTQTDVEYIELDSQSSDHKLVSNSTKSEPLVPKSNVSQILSENRLSKFCENKITSKSDSTGNSSFELSETQKKGFNRLPAMVKGYLTRRLMKTEKVLHKIETIRDTTQLLSKYRTPAKVSAEDINFHKRLIIQLESSCHEFYDIFFNYPKSSQMALIGRSREHILDRHYRTASVLSNTSYLNASFRNQGSPHTVCLSSVTKKVLQRKKQKGRTSGSNLNSTFTLKSNQSSSTSKRSLGTTVVKISERVNPSLRRSQRNTATNVVQNTHKRKANFDNK